jgi:hypothetical protein
MGEVLGCCGGGTTGLGEVVAVGSGDSLDHADIQQPALLPR